MTQEALKKMQWHVLTQAQYDALETKNPNDVYAIVDDKGDYTETKLNKMIFNVMSADTYKVLETKDPNQIYYVTGENEIIEHKSWTDGTQTSVPNVPTNSPSFHLGIGDESAVGDAATINVPYNILTRAAANECNFSAEAYIIDEPDATKQTSLETRISTDNKTTKTYSYDSDVTSDKIFAYGDIYKNTSNMFYYAQLSGSFQFVYPGDDEYTTPEDHGDGSYSILTGWNTRVYDFGFIVYPNGGNPFTSMDSSKSMIFTYNTSYDLHTDDFKNLFFFVPSGYTLCAVILNSMVHKWAEITRAYFDLVCSDTFNYYSQSDQQEELDAISAITAELTARGNTITSLNTQGQNLVTAYNNLADKYNTAGIIVTED